MRFVHIYLAGYFILAAAAALVLWRVGVLARLSGFSILVAAAIVVGLGLLLAIVSPRPTLARE